MEVSQKTLSVFDVLYKTNNSFDEIIMHKFLSVEHFGNLLPLHILKFRVCIICRFSS